MEAGDTLQYPYQIYATALSTLLAHALTLQALTTQHGHMHTGHVIVVRQNIGPSTLMLLHLHIMPLKPFMQLSKRNTPELQYLMISHLAITPPSGIATCVMRKYSASTAPVVTNATKYSAENV